MANIVNITFKLHFQKEMSFSLFFSLDREAVASHFLPNTASQSPLWGCYRCYCWLLISLLIGGKDCLASWQHGGTFRVHYFYLSKIYKQLFSSSSIICPYPSLTMPSPPLFFETAGRRRCRQCVPLVCVFTAVYSTIVCSTRANSSSNCSFPSTPGRQADLCEASTSLRLRVWQVLLLRMQLRLSR